MSTTLYETVNINSAYWIPIKKQSVTQSTVVPHWYNFYLNFTIFRNRKTNSNPCKKLRDLQDLFAVSRKFVTPVFQQKAPLRFFRAITEV